MGITGGTRVYRTASSFFPDGKVEFVELKTDTGRTTPLQKAQLRRLVQLNCTVHVLYGEQDVNEYLDMHAMRFD